MGLTTDSFDRRAWTTRDGARAPSKVRIAVLVGLMLGALVSADTLLVHRIPPLGFDVPRQIPFLLSLLFVFAVVAAFMSLWTGVFARRLDIALVSVMVAISVSGLGQSSVEATDFVIPVVLLLWLFAAIVEQRPVQVPRLAVVLALILVVFCIGSVFNGGFRSLLNHVRPVKVLLIAFLAADFIDGPHRCRLAARWFVTIAVLSAVIAVVSGILDVTAGISLTAWDNTRYQTKATPFGDMMRVTAFMATAQVLAHFLILGVAMLLPSRTRPFWKVIGIVVLCAGVLWTLSTGAYVVLAITLVGWLFIRRPERSIQYALILTSVAVFAYVAGVSDWWSSSGLSRLASNPAHDRVVHMRMAVIQILQHPLAGCGVGAAPRGPDGVVHVHNTYLQAATELGIPGALVVIGMLLSLAVAAAIAIKRLPRGEHRDRCKGVLLGVVALAIHWNTEPFLYNAGSWLFIGIGTGIVAYYWRELRSARHRIESSPDGVGGSAAGEPLPEGHGRR